MILLTWAITQLYTTINLMTPWLNAVTSITVTKIKIVSHHSYIRISTKKKKKIGRCANFISAVLELIIYLRYIKARL